MRNFVLGLAALLASSTAFLPAQSLASLPAVPVSVPGLPAVAGAARMVAGDVTQDLLPDLAIVSEGQMFLLINPGCMARVAQLTGPVLDVTLLGNELAILTPAAILVGTYEANAVPAHWTLRVAATPPADARLVRAARLDGDDLPDLVVVGGAQSRTLTLLHNTGTELVAAGGWTLAASVQDLIAAPLDATPADELAVLTDGGLLLLRADGTVLQSVRSLHAEQMAICLTRAPLGSCRVLFTRFAANGVDHLLQQVGLNGLEATWNLGTVHPLALCSGDYQQDGDGDVLLTRANAWEPLILLNHSESTGQPDFAIGPGSSLVVDLAPLVLPVNAQPGPACWTDTNLDGVLDVNLPLFGTQTVACVNSGAPLTGGLPTAHPAFRRAHYVVENGAGRLELDLALPVTPTLATIELTVWAHTWGQVYINPNPIQRVYLDAASAVPGDGEEPPFNGANCRIVLPMLAGDGDLCFASHRRYYFTVRTVALGPSSTLNASSQVWVGGWAGGDTRPQTMTPEIPPLQADRQQGFEPIPYWFIRYGDALGLMVPMPAVPHFAPTLD